MYGRTLTTTAEERIYEVLIHVLKDMAGNKGSQQFDHTFTKTALQKHSALLKAGISSPNMLGKIPAWFAKDTASSVGEGRGGSFLAKVFLLL